MPQLDQITFFPQFFWCVFFFIVFFFYFSFSIMPNITTILKFRKLKLISLANKINKKKDSSVNLSQKQNFIMGNTIFKGKQLIVNSLQKGTLWVGSNNFKINSKDLFFLYQKFLLNN